MSLSRTATEILAGVYEFGAHVTATHRVLQFKHDIRNNTALDRFNPLMDTGNYSAHRII